MEAAYQVMVVDDEPRMTRSIALLLEGQGFEFKEAHSASQALEIIRNTDFDLLMFDISLPDMDGFNLMSRVSHLQPDTPVIIFTGSSSIDTAIKALQMGAYGYLRKPIEPEELKRTVSNAIDKKRLHDQNKVMTGKLKQSEQLFRRLIQNSPDFIYTLDRKGCFKFVNATATQLLGFEKEELLGRPYRSIMANGAHNPDDDFFLSNRVSELVRKDGTICFVETTVSLLKDASGRVIGCQGIDRNISRRKKLEIALLDSLSMLEESKNSTIMGLAKLAEYRDQNTGLHLERISEYVRIITRALVDQPRFNSYITETYVEDISKSSILHDIGKVGIPDLILLKPGKLNEQEYGIMKRHSKIGGDALAAIEGRLKGQSFLTLGKEIAYHHHERWDGNGYPYGLKGEDIPLSARLVALADVYDALTTERSYKTAFSHQETLGIIRAARETQFDPLIVDLFLERENNFNEIRLGLSDQHAMTACMTADEISQFYHPNSARGVFTKN